MGRLQPDFLSYRPPVHRFSPAEIGPEGRYDPFTDCAVTADGNPAIPPSTDEVEISRWELAQGDGSPTVHVDIPLDTDGRGIGSAEHGELTPATVVAGEAKCLVTTRALRFTAYSGKLLDKVKGSRTVLAFTVPLSVITSVDPGRSTAFYAATWLTIHLDEWDAVISVMKAERAGARFESGILATNKTKDFAAQIDAARVRFAPGDGTAKPPAPPPTVASRGVHIPATAPNPEGRADAPPPAGHAPRDHAAQRWDESIAEPTDDDPILEVIASLGADPTAIRQAIAYRDFAASGAVEFAETRSSLVRALPDHARLNPGARNVMGGQPVRGGLVLCTDDALLWTSSFATGTDGVVIEEEVTTRTMGFDAILGARVADARKGLVDVWLDDGYTLTFRVGSADAGQLAEYIERASSA